LELLELEVSASTLTHEQEKLADKLGIERQTLERQVEMGALINRRCKILYPIVSGVPRLLTFSTPICAVFVERYKDILRRKLPGYSLPQESPMPGETDVLRSFSTEWINYDWNDRAYWGLSPEQLFKAMHFMLDFARYPVAGKRVVEVGIGIGGIADNIASTQGCELVGLDLSYAVELAYRHFGSRNPFFHVVQASVFKPPVPDQSFDLVYSHGVLHHTYSTQEALESIARLPCKGGRLYAWVYSPFDERRTILRRVLYALEQLFRPLCWRLPPTLQTIVLTPIVPFYMIYQNFWRRGEGIRYGWREAMHAARDRFTPRYVHRHSGEELSEWFHALGYRKICCASSRQRPEYVPVAFVACAGVYGIRETGIDHVGCVNPTSVKAVLR